MIIIDPSHGGAQLGAADNFLYEKYLNLDISKIFANKLKQDVYKVYFTRNNDNKDIELLDRTDAAEDMAISDDWIYYVNKIDKYRPYRVKIDGKKTNLQILRVQIS